MSEIQTLSLTLAFGMGIYFLVRFIKTSKQRQHYSTLPSASDEELHIVQSHIKSDDIVRLNALVSLLKTNRKIEAIKLTRELTGMDLKASKELVEKINF